MTKKFALPAALALAIASLPQATLAGYDVYTGDNGGFVTNSATAAYLSAQGPPTEFFSFSSDKFVNPFTASNDDTQIAGNAFSDGVTFSSLVSSTNGGVASTNVELGFSSAETSEIGPSAGFGGTLDIDFLAAGGSVEAVGFGTVA